MAKRARPTSRYGKSAQVGRETGRHSPQRLIPPELGAIEGYAGRPGRAGGTIALAARGKKKTSSVLGCGVGSSKGYGSPGRVGGIRALAARGTLRHTRQWKVTSQNFAPVPYKGYVRAGRAGGAPALGAGETRTYRPYGVSLPPELGNRAVQGVREVGVGRAGQQRRPPGSRSTTPVWGWCPTRGTRGRTRPGGATALAAGQPEHNSRMGVVPYKGYERSE